jgi:signal transduction histidine kinase
MVIPMHSLCQNDQDAEVLEIEMAGMKDSRKKADRLMELTNLYLYTDQKKALSTSDRLIDLSAKINYPGGLIDGYAAKGKVYRTLLQYDSSLVFTDMAIYLADSLSDEHRLAAVYADKGHTLFRKSGPAEGVNYYELSYDLYNGLSDSLGMTNALNGIGVMHIRMGNHDLAVYYFLELTRIAERLGYREVLGKAYVNLGISYFELKDYKMASQYLEKSIGINREFNREDFVIIAKNNLGGIAFQKKEMDTAMAFFEEALQLNRKVGDQLSIANVMNNIGNVYESKGNYDSAFHYYNKSKSIYERAGAINDFILAYKNIGLIYERWGNYDRALEIYDSCLNIANRSNNLYARHEILYNMAKAHELKGDFNRAFQFLELYNHDRDTLFSEERSNKIASLQVVYETEQKQAKILQQELIIEKRNSQLIILLLAGIGLIGFVVLIALYFRQRYVKDKIIKEQKIRQLEEEKKLLAAKALVEGQEDERKRIAQELHDGLGVLLSTARMQFTSIKDKSPENRPLIERAAKLLEQASGDVRKISHNMMPGLLTRLGLFEATIELMEKVAETEGIHVTCEVPEDADRLTENSEIMLYRVLQEMVNNTLKHARARNISLRMTLDEGLLKIVYSDDGIGFNVEEKLEQKTLGLSGIMSRVNFLNGKVSINSSENNGVGYDITIPLVDR